jgi:hypothetical protein
MNVCEGDLRGHTFWLVIFWMIYTKIGLPPPLVLASNVGLPSISLPQTTG